MTASPEALAAGEALFAPQVTFLRGVVDVAQLPVMDRPEIAFAGRSNVGKSSLINAVCNQNGLARASNEPGRTRELNFFDVASRFWLVDMPGYGFAKAPKPLIERWTALMQRYLAGRANLKRVMLLIDARRGITGADEAMMTDLTRAAVVHQIVLTKMDKLKPAEQDAIRVATGRAVGRRPAVFPQLLETSTTTGAGIPELRACLAEACGLV